MRSHCGVNLQFLNDQLCWASFHALICHLCIFFGEVSLQIFCLFLNWIVFLSLSLEGSVCILDTNPIKDLCFAKIPCPLPPAPVCGLSFHFFRSVFQSTIIFNFDEVQFINLFFYGLYLVLSYLRHLYLTQNHKGLVYVFFLRRNFRFHIRTMIHFEFIFINSVRHGLDFTFCL